MFIDREPPGRLARVEQNLLMDPALDPGRTRRGGTGDDRKRSFLSERIPSRFHPGTEEDIPWPEGDL
jgi:hypothetical protein